MMMRALLFLFVFPPVLGAQETFVGVRLGQNVAQLSHDRTRSGPAFEVFAQADFSDHAGVGWNTSWVQTAVDDLTRTSSSAMPPVAEPGYLLTELVGRLSASRTVGTDERFRLGASVTGGGWTGYRAGGERIDVERMGSDVRRFDFGHVWGVSLFAITGRVKLDVDLRAYHGERALWEGARKQRGARALVGLAYRARD